ncbi:tyrosine-type recombinase/integrase [Sporosalibacterium faouarense]|uniref:tyrosine-type recombinase/integrase n=1 Tax=Sporosalibacterium faouarense TaxID=516123 RepID=UPI00311CD5A6
MASKKTIIVRIRSYIRFLEFSDGFKSEAILKLPMTSPVWKRASLPKYLSDTELDRLFSSYDRNKPSGIRNYAIARCLKDLGLRCSEVAGLSLDDFDWMQGIVAIKKTKSHFKRILPLHAITGQAIEAYLLHFRPATSERILFVRFKNRQGEAMGTSQVRNTVRSAAIRAGLDNFTGTHMLRHTAAKEMINSGVDLKTIADVLGHESIETTCIYTKLDFNQLQDVAGTWPEVIV